MVIPCANPNPEKIWFSGYIAVRIEITFSLINTLCSTNFGQCHVIDVVQDSTFQYMVI